MKYLTVWNKLYKRENICDVLFEDVVSEDFEYNLKVFLKSKRAICVNDILLLSKSKLYYSQRYY